jgi:hypothetical protein
MQIKTKTETKTKSVLSVLDDVKLFEEYQVSICFLDKVLGGCPAMGDMLEFYMEAKHMSDKEKEEFRERVRDGKLLDNELVSAKESNCCVFERDNEQCLTIWHANVKALLRECAVTLGITQLPPGKRKSNDDNAGHAGGRQTLQHGLHIDPLRIRLLKDGKPIKKADGNVDRIKHISDASGRRSAIGRHEYVEKAQATFTIKWPINGAFKEEHIKRMLKLAEGDGLGASRSQGFGKFVVTEFKKIK